MKNNQGFTRGHRAKSEIIEWNDCILTEEEIDDVIQPFITTNIFKIPNQEIYLSSKENT